MILEDTLVDHNTIHSCDVEYTESCQRFEVVIEYEHDPLKSSLESFEFTITIGIALSFGMFDLTLNKTRVSSTEITMCWRWAENSVNTSQFHLNSTLTPSCMVVDSKQKGCMSLN
jgi:hypothetical protein